MTTSFGGAVRLKTSGRSKLRLVRPSPKNGTKNSQPSTTAAMAPIQRPEARLREVCISSEFETEPRHEGPLPRQFVIKIQRIQLVVLIGEIEHADGDLRPALPQTVAGKRVELENLIIGERGRV